MYSPNAKRNTGRDSRGMPTVLPSWSCKNLDREVKKGELTKAGLLSQWASTKERSTLLQRDDID